MRRRSAAALAFALLALLFGAIWRWSAGPAPTVTSLQRGAARAPTRSNVVLLTIDTLRPDHLGTYGYRQPTSPNLDRFASSSVVFEDAVASSAWTSPGLVSVLTGLFAVRHRVVGPAASVPPGTPTLASLLARAGYEVPNLVYLTSIPNYANLGFGPPLSKYFDETTGTDEASRWLDHGPEEPFFLWYHYRYIHLPYQPERAALESAWPGATTPTPPESAGLTAVRNDVIVPRDSVAFALPGDRDEVTHLYDGEVRTMDEWFGALLERLERDGLLDRSLVVVTADHGEELFDHGWVGHASTTLHGSLHEELIRIPLIIRFPNARDAGRRITSQARGVDVLPTVLEELGLEAPANLDGHSLLSVLRGEPAASAPAILETAIAGYQTPPDREGERLAGIRDEGWKLVVNCGVSHPRLFHVGADRSESIDLAGTGDPHELALRTELTQYLGTWDPGFLVGRCAWETQSAEPGETTTAPCPVVEEPVDGAVLHFEDHGGIVRARWSGSETARYQLEYELGEGRFHTVGRMPVTGNRQEFGPFPRSVWGSFRDFNPWRVRVVLTGRAECAPADVRFRF